MPRKRIDMRKIREVLRLRFGAGASVRQAALSCHLSTSTVAEYGYRAAAAGYGWPLPDGVDDEELERALFPPRPRAGEKPRPLPDWNQVRKELGRKGVTLQLLWREYKAEHADGYGYARFAGLYAEWEKRSDVRMLQRHKAGEKMFVDYAGHTAKLADPETGEVRDVQVFVAAMGSSQKLYARAVEGQDLASWLSAHVHAFEFFGALPQVLVPDNLKAGVTSPCYYDPVLNQAYAELAAFYGLTVLPARVRKPRDKSKVENAVQQVERWVLAPLRDRVFFSMSELNEAMAALTDQGNARVMKGPGASRDELFAQEDLPAMRPLPASRYAYAQWKIAKVAPDHHVEFEGHKYSVPHTLVGKKVEVKIGDNVVEAFFGSKKVASHLRSLSKRGFTTDPSHRPESHSQAMWNPERLVRWAEKIGPEAAVFTQRVLDSKCHVEQGYRTVLGVLRLEKACGKDRLNAACAKANAVGALRYGNVKSILDKNLETVPLSLERRSLPLHDNVRGAGYYAKEESCAN